MATYFPDGYPKGRACNREYFFSVLATLHPKYFDALIRSCKDARNKVNTDEQKNNAIVITQRWADELSEFSNYGKKKGRMVHSKFISLDFLIAMFNISAQTKKQDWYCF